MTSIDLSYLFGTAQQEIDVFFQPRMLGDIQFDIPPLLHFFRLR